MLVLMVLLMMMLLYCRYYCLLNYSKFIYLKKLIPCSLNVVIFNKLSKNPILTTGTPKEDIDYNNNTYMDEEENNATVSYSPVQKGIKRKFDSSENYNPPLIRRCYDDQREPANNVPIDYSSSSKRNAKRKIEETFDHEEEQNEETKEQCLDQHRFKKSRFQSSWINAVLFFKQYNNATVLVRILAKESWGWMVYLKDDLYVPGVDTSEYRQGVKYWVKWGGLVDPMYNHIPIVYPVHQC
eukprot:TRINITY_DN1132_c0_g1_i1.p1 TRINITY_DN1132_c0_g1~~TRINITY_DN1132_c0_g1_i1.p1  ORF type:complete len:240 (-),score=44.07 TRINITY_DN1132_c0_g1_i1:72-791(-)